MEDIENRMVMDNQWKDYMSNNSDNPFDNATTSSVISFLLDKERLHEVVAQFMGVEDVDYEQYRSEQILLELTTKEGRDYLIRRYLAHNDIEDDYNEWAMRYRHSEEP